tara:strand:+ start:940 stop:1794 length:855 start_codon:yes stop_codon:yes gene_type:complete
MQDDNQKLSNIEYEDDIDFGRIFDTLLAKKALIIKIVSIFAISSIVFSLLLPNKYTARATLASVESQGSSISASMGSQLGGLASLAGIDLGTSGGDSDAAIEIMQSWFFIEKFLEENNLEEKLTGDGLFGGNGQATSFQLYERFIEKISISQDKKTGFITLTLEDRSPNIAKEWLELYVGSINEFMRLRKLEQVSKNMEYLQREISKTSIAEMKEIFFEIIKDQTKNQMLAEATKEYVFITINNSMVPEKKSSPKRAIIVIIATFLGFIFATYYILIIDKARQD